MLIYDIETAANEQSNAYFSKKEYLPDSALSTINEPPTKITELKSDELRETRLAEWRESQSDKIAKSIETKRMADHNKAALHWWTGKVICFGGISTEGERISYTQPEEKDLLNELGKYLTINNPKLIGKSSEDFDKPFLIGRYMHHDLGVPSALKTTHQITDVNQCFSMRTSCSQITSLSNYSWGLCIGEKGGKGSDIAEWYAAGDMKKIQEYCMHDVALTMKIYKRWEKEFVI